MSEGLANMDNITTAVVSTSYGVSIGTTFLGLTVDQWGIAAAVVGIIGVCATFAFTAWFKMKYGR